MECLEQVAYSWEGKESLICRDSSEVVDGTLGGTLVENAEDTLDTSLDDREDGGNQGDRGDQGCRGNPEEGGCQGDRGSHHTWLVAASSCGVGTFEPSSSAGEV